MRFTAGVTLYNPTEEQLARIVELQNSFDKIFLFDNSEPEYSKPLYPQSEKIVLLTENENKGLPYAFNTIIAHCHEYDFLCTLDQDSTFKQADILRIRSYIEELKNLEMIGIVAPYIDYGYNEHKNSVQVEKKNWVITSGAFVNLNIIRKEGFRYDENYFIDKFEIDLCRQMTTKGYDILMYYPSVLNQKLGETHGKVRSNHNALRHYYLFRNRFYFNNKWFYGPKKWLLNIAQTTKHLFIILKNENEKIRKLKVFVEAFLDFRKGRMGKKIQ